MSFISTIHKLGLVPLNTTIAIRVASDENLRKHWSGLISKKQTVLTIKAEHIEPYMFHYGVEGGYYVLDTSAGPMRTAYKKSYYLSLLGKYDFFTIVVAKKSLVYGAFHNGKPYYNKMLKLGAMANEHRDSQRQKLYDWQHRYDALFKVLQRVLTKAEVKTMVYSILTKYGYDLSRVVIRDKWKGSKNAIANHTFVFESKLDLGTFMGIIYSFNDTAVGTILHEVAHSIAMSEYAQIKGPIAGHGPEYCLILAELFDNYAGIPVKVTLGSMQEAGLKVEPLEDFFDGKKFPYYEKL